MTFKLSKNDRWTHFRSWKIKENFGSRSITFLVQLWLSRNCCCILSTFWKKNRYKKTISNAELNPMLRRKVWISSKSTCLTWAWFFLSFRNFSISAWRFGFLCFCKTSNISSVLFESVPRIFRFYRILLKVNASGKRGTGGYKDDWIRPPKIFLYKISFNAKTEVEMTQKRAR